MSNPARDTAPSSAEWVTLITGDQVAVDPDGHPIGLRRGEGRADIPVQVRREGGHVHVVPQDAAALLAEGRLDHRLFDVTLLARSEYRDAARRRGVGLLVTYQNGGSRASSRLRAADGVRVTHTFGEVNGQAVAVPEREAGGLWKAMTTQTDGSPHAGLAPGVAKVWLNSLHQALLDRSVAQIGAPTAWAAGFDGQGIKVAVLDTGVDTGHADLPGGGKVVAERNFTASADVHDHYGHGTHVASTAAGTGAHSQGRYKGVAPAAGILNGKVLGDDGYGDDAGIIAGMEWAVAEGARVVSMSLGGADTPGVDPLEETVNRLSAQTGALFVVAAGNDGPGDSTLGSPGTADAALTVGAVAADGNLAPFSSRGPRLGDGAIKPDVTAPGVDISAAAASGSILDTDPDVPHPTDGYLTISGTSMATPHVAGAAALLFQQHPGWSGAHVRSVLIGSAADGGHTAYAQGSGRVDVGAAIGQEVTAAPASLNFGTAAWPHEDDRPLVRTVTYRNHGTRDVDLDLAVSGIGPDGRPAPEGFFTVDRSRIRVPAGGTGEVTVTVDTRLGAHLDGAYSASVVAVGDGRRVRTAAAAVREAEVYDLTIRNLDRGGRPAAVFNTLLYRLDAFMHTEITQDTASTTLRLPKGTYSVDSLIPHRAGLTGASGLDWLSSPTLRLDADTTLTLDARRARPLTVEVPDRRAVHSDLAAGYSLDVGLGHALSFNSGTMKDFRTAHVGPRVPGDRLQASVTSLHEHGSRVYTTAYGRTGTFWSGHHERVTARELARVDTTAGGSVDGRTGLLFTTSTVNRAATFATAVTGTLPYTKSVYTAGPGVTWAQDFMQVNPGEGNVLETLYSAESRPFARGRTYRNTFNVGVFGPRLGASNVGLVRTGDTLFAQTGLFDDGQGHDGYSLRTGGRTTIHRDDVLVAAADVPLDEGVAFDLPPAGGRYLVATSATRTGPASVSTRITAQWTFPSAHVPNGEEARLPVSVVRFTPSLSVRSTAPAGKSLDVPVIVQGAAAGRALASLTVEYSTDSGRRWTRAEVRNGSIRVKNPAEDRTVSLRAHVRDDRGNTLVQTILDAYRAG
ncbi:S8 family peptidase [Streptomyces sp. NPDC086010]|uniref:S8 family peptidase n=1 Tax=Streptomyces sp. NPDC086010 TaxID=3365745 RepID=UPI0037D93EF4